MNIPFQGDSIADAGRAGDSVHPTPMGHEFIKRESLRVYKSL